MDPFLSYFNNLSADPICTTKTNIHVVIGNESCDLDSTVCSLVLAYFLNKYDESNTYSAVVPVLNTTSEEFLLRTENCYVLRKVGLDIKTLLFKDTINLCELQKNSNLKVTLVDHHVLSEENQFLEKSVVQIFDHRPLDNTVTWDDDVKMNIKLVGSCATLIAEEIFNKNMTALCSNMSRLLYDAIVFDTIGLNPEAGKVKELDFHMCQKLELILGISPERKELFEELWSAHNDVSHLSAKQLLLKDLKIVENILIPGLPMLVQDYLKLPDVLPALNSICTSKDCNIIVLMGLEASEGKVRRDIAFYSVESECELLNVIKEYLKGNEELQLVEVPVDDLEITCFEQINIKPSRKQIIPLIKESLRQSDVLSVNE